MTYSSHGGAFTIPERMMGGLTRYVEHGVLPGHFLRAVLSNDLKEAIGRADLENLAALPAYIVWLYNEAPAPCWGSPDKVAEWVKEKAAERTGTA